MKNYKTIQTTKHSDGTYTVEIVSSRLALLKAFFSGTFSLTLPALDAAVLSTGLFTPKKKPYKKPVAKKAVEKVSE